MERNLLKLIRYLRTLGLVHYLGEDNFTRFLEELNLIDLWIDSYNYTKLKNHRKKFKYDDELKLLSFEVFTEDVFHKETKTIHDAYKVLILFLKGFTSASGTSSFEEILSEIRGKVSSVELNNFNKAIQTLKSEGKLSQREIDAIDWSKSNKLQKEDLKSQDKSQNLIEKFKQELKNKIKNGNIDNAVNELNEYEKGIKNKELKNHIILVINSWRQYKTKTITNRLHSNEESVERQRNLYMLLGIIDAIK